MIAFVIKSQKQKSQIANLQAKSPTTTFNKVINI